MRVVHVIGLVGAGKTYFINTWFPEITEVFDIKTVYEMHNFSPETLQGNPQLYSAFKQVLQDYLKHFMEYYADMGFFIAESSGTNRAFNELFRNLEEYRIWIEPDYVRIIKTVSTQQRPYAKRLNEYLQKKFERGEIYFDNSYNTINKSFSRPLPQFLKLNI